MREKLNDEESTNGLCDHCRMRISDCECEDIHCQTCEDFRARRHRCVQVPERCEYCDELMDNCECKPSWLYD